MSDTVDRLFGEYVAEHQAGGDADPSDFLTRATLEADRLELATLIDGYLARAPRRQWDPAAFKGSRAERVADGLDRALTGAAGLWPTELPRLRQRAQLRRAEVVERLAKALGVGGREQKVAAYYHEMEQGMLDPSGVSDRVLDALAAIVGTTVDALRRAGEAVGPTGGSSSPSDAVFARTALPDVDFAVSAAAPDDSDTTGNERWDEVDELFQGG